MPRATIGGGTKTVFRFHPVLVDAVTFRVSFATFLHTVGIPWDTPISKDIILEFISEYTMKENCFAAVA